MQLAAPGRVLRALPALTEGGGCELSNPPAVPRVHRVAGQEGSRRGARVLAQAARGFEHPDPACGRPSARGRHRRVAGGRRGALPVDEDDGRAAGRAPRSAAMSRPTRSRRARGLLVLSQYSGTRDVLFGVTVAGRPPSSPGRAGHRRAVHQHDPAAHRPCPSRRRGSTVADWLKSLLAPQRRDATARARAAGGDPGAERAAARSAAVRQPVRVRERAARRLAACGASTSSTRTSNSHRTHTNYPLTVVVIPGARVKLLLSYDERLFEPR